MQNVNCVVNTIHAYVLSCAGCEYYDSVCYGFRFNVFFVFGKWCGCTDKCTLQYMDINGDIELFGNILMT